MKKIKYILKDSKENGDGFLYSLLGEDDSVVFHTCDSVDNAIGRAVQAVLCQAVDLGKQDKISLIIDIKGCSYRKFELISK